MFEKMLKVRATNPNTGEVVEYWKVRTTQGEEYRVLNTEEELKQCGNTAALFSRLVVREGNFGKFASLRRSEIIEDAKLF